MRLPPLKRRPLNIYEVADIQRAALLAREDKAVRRILSAWKIAEQSINKRLADVTDKIAAAYEAGEPVGEAWLYQQSRYYTLLAQIHDETMKFADTASVIASDQQAAGVKLGTGDAQSLVRAAGIQTGFKKLPARAFEDVVGMLSDGSPLADLFKGIGPQAVATARRVFIEEVASGQHPRRIASRLSQELGMARDRAVLIARTESIRAYRVAQLRNYSNNSDVVTGWRWTAALDRRCCPICTAMDGQEFPLDEPFGSHAACRCSPTPIVRFFDVGRQTGEEWFEDQPEEEQLQKLGPSRYKLWSSGVVTLKDMVQVTQSPRWGPGRKMKNLAQLRHEILMGTTGKLPKQ